jgi:hypothetical protein
MESPFSAALSIDERISLAAILLRSATVWKIRSISYLFFVGMVGKAWHGM